MADLWRWLMSWLVWLSADPDAMAVEQPRAAASVAAAYATFTPEPTPERRPVRPTGPITSDPR